MGNSSDRGHRLHISRFVLGPYWRSTSEAERQQFKDLLEAHLARFYGQRFAEYNGESLRVIGSRTEPGGAIVASEIIRPQGPPIKVDWRLTRLRRFDPASHNFRRASD